MVNWRDPLVEALCGFVFGSLLIFMVGFYLWYIVLTLDRVEIPLLRRKMKFRFIHVPYLFGRYCQFATLLSGFVGTLLIRPTVDCRGLPTLSIASGLNNIALVAASANLALRAVIMWKDVRIVLTALCLAFGVHLTVAIVVVSDSKAAGPIWDPVAHVCTYRFALVRRFLLGFYALTLAWDIVILALTMAGMRRQKLPPHSTLWSALFQQGFGYLLITCLTCIPMIILIALDLNDVMNSIAAPTGSTLSVITSSAFAISLRDAATAPEPLSDPTSDTEDEQLPGPGGGGNALTTHIDMLSTVDSSQTWDERFMDRDRRRYWNDDQ